MSAALRREVEALREAVERAGRVLRAEGMYQPPGWSNRVREQAVLRNKAMQHELTTLAGIAARLDKATTPRVRASYLQLPAVGTVARTLLEVLHVNALGHDHRGLRELAGLTDAELAVRITGAGPNTVRPRRLDLQRTGWVRDSERSVGRLTVWELTPDGRRAMDGLGSGQVAHLMADSLLDACGTAPRGSLSVTPVRDHVTCVACLRLPVPAEEVAAGE